MRSRLILLLPLCIVPCAVSLRAQAIDDGLLFQRRALMTGVLYAHEGWTHYWEGSLNRDNDNVGTVTTQSVRLVAGYGVTDRLSVMAMLPYVWTHASQGPLHGMEGVQDVTLAAKYRLLETPLTNRGTLRALVVGAAGIPASNYTPDFLPLSIGQASRQFSGRFTLNFRAHEGWFINSSAAYTWRTKVTLDRPAYFTNGQLYLSNEVSMPNVFDYSVSAGYQGGRVCIPIGFSQQLTLGGGDIRRQDMPFVSNRMDFVRLDGALMYSLPAPNALAIRVGANRVVSGRNVGEGTTLLAGLFYTFHL